jgi:hypothetical protein
MILFMIQDVDSGIWEWFPDRECHPWSMFMSRIQDGDLGWAADIVVGSVFSPLVC